MFVSLRFLKEYVFKYLEKPGFVPAKIIFQVLRFKICIFYNSPILTPLILRKILVNKTNMKNLLSSETTAKETGLE